MEHTFQHAPARIEQAYVTYVYRGAFSSLPILPRAGQRVVHNLGYMPGKGIGIYERPTDTYPEGPSTMLFRIGEIEGLADDSFTPLLRTHAGRCHAFTVLEELPLHLAFGPQGAEALALTADVERLTEPDIRCLGRLSMDDDVNANWYGWFGFLELTHGVTDCWRRIGRHFESLAQASDDPTVMGWVQGCDWERAIVDPTWQAAQSAVLPAVAATMYADRIDPRLAATACATRRRFCDGARALSG